VPRGADERFQYRLLNVIERGKDSAYAICSRRRPLVDAADLDLADKTVIAQAHAQLPCFAQRNLLRRDKQHAGAADIEQGDGGPYRSLKLGALSYWQATRPAPLRDGASMVSPGPGHVPKHIIDGHWNVNPFNTNEVAPIAAADTMLPHVSHLGFDFACLAVERQSAGDARSNGQRHCRLDKCPAGSYVSYTEALDCLECSG